MQCRIQRTGVLRSRVERPAIPALCSVGGCASALRRCLAGRRRPPAFARPITVVLPASGDVHPDGHGLQSCPADNAGAGGGVATPEICSELAKTGTDFHNNGEFRVMIRPIAPQNGFFPQPALMFAFKGPDANIRFRGSGLIGAHGRRQDPKTPVEQALMRGLVTG